MMEAQRRLTRKLVDTKLEKGNWSMSGGRVRLGRAGTSGGRDSVMLPVSKAWWSGKEHKRQPRTLSSAHPPVRLAVTTDRVPPPVSGSGKEAGGVGQLNSRRDSISTLKGLTFCPLQQRSQLGRDLQAAQVLVE